MAIKSILLTLMFSVLLTSCNQSKIELLEEKIKEKNNKIELLEKKLILAEDIIVIKRTENKNLKNDLSKQKKKNNTISHRSDNDIINIVKSEMSFKCPKTLTKDFVVRKTNSDRYEVRFNQKLNGIEWEQIVVKIKLFPGNKYTYNVWDGTICNR